MRLAYLVSRFPAASETFVLRELNAVQERVGAPIELLSLFPAGDTDVVHPAARPWLGSLRRPGASAALGSIGWWAVRRPLRLLGTLAGVLAGTFRRPGVLLRSLIALAVASAHARALAGSRVDHVHAHFATYPALGAWVCRRLTGIPYSFTAHAHDIFIHQLMLARKIADARFVVAISEYNREFMAAVAPGSSTPIEVVHCGLELENYSFRPRRVPMEGEVQALCVAGLRESKGHAVLFAALAGGEGLERVHLDLVGDGPLRKELVRLAAELGIAARIRFHGGLTEPEVTRLLDGADLFVLPSVITADGDMEGIPVALMESMASGIPTVATRMSGIPELIDDGRTGLLAVPGDPDDLRRAVAAALSGTPEIDLGGARERIEKEFDVKRSAEKMVELFGCD